MVIAPEIGIESYISIDLSIQNTSLSINDLRSSSSFSNYINAYLESHSKQIAYGGYLERRLLYSRSIHFNTNISERRLLMETWGLQEDLARDRGDDREDHDCQHHSGGQHGPATGRQGAREEWEKVQVRVQPGVDVARHDRGENRDAPDTEHHARNGREKVDQITE